MGVAAARVPEGKATEASHVAKLLQALAKQAYVSGTAAKRLQANAQRSTLALRFRPSKCISNASPLIAVCASASPPCLQWETSLSIANAGHPKEYYCAASMTSGNFRSTKSLSVELAKALHRCDLHPVHVDIATVCVDALLSSLEGLPLNKHTSHLLHRSTSSFVKHDEE